MALSIITFLISFVVFRDLNVGIWPRLNALSTQTKNLLSSWIILICILLFLGYTTKSSDDFSRRVIITWITVTPFALLLTYYVGTIIIRRFFNPAKSGRNCVIVGMNRISENLIAEISRDYLLGINFLGYFDDRNQARLVSTHKVKNLGFFNQIAGFVKNNRVELIYITLPMVQEKRILKILDELSDTTASIYFVPDLFVFDLISARIDDINGIPALAICESPFFGIPGLLKRFSDIIMASLILLLILPLMVVIAIAIRIDSSGPIIFRQRRYGLDGREIVVYKFRSMRVTEDGNSVKQATRDDDRVTKLGRFLRKSSLDELPQFINVLQGRMSVVGPRPHAVAHNESYRKVVKGYMIRHKVRPGITGWAQVNGFRGETDTVDKMKARIKYDLDYLRHWSLRLDAVIILRTITIIFKDHNAY